MRERERERERVEFTGGEAVEPAVAGRLFSCYFFFRLKE
jgi:hypothetical protein